MINKTENYMIDSPPRHTGFVKRLHLALLMHDNWLPILEHLWPQAVFAERSTTRAKFWESR